jgi:methylenetetrahydrofolate--tRNA-(uracil-5-)-methyltransferase
MPIEELARRGPKTLSFGPMKPVGLTDPRTGKKSYAVVQLRHENKAGTAFNLVGFQTKLTYPEQKRIFKTIPGLENAEFFRFGSIHRNTFINSPSLIGPDMDLKSHPGIYFAGQITGVEGYVESATIGLLTSLNAVKKIKGEEFIPPPLESAMGSLYKYITKGKHSSFQPTNINFGLFEVKEMRIRDKKLRNQKIFENALASLGRWKELNTAKVKSTG